jgi:ferritin-like metal-binding protein YciE
MPALNTLDSLFVNELRDIYDAEKQLTKALPKMAKAASSDELRTAFENHLKQTEGHVNRLERAFEDIGEAAKGVRCVGMAGLVEEGSKILEEKADESVRDAALIAAAQKVEHYEIAAYGTLVTFAETLGHSDVGQLLADTLAEEKEADRTLTEIAEGIVNLEATDAGDTPPRKELTGSARGRGQTSSRRK